MLSFGIHVLSGETYKQPLLFVQYVLIHKRVILFWHSVTTPSAEGVGGYFDVWLCCFRVFNFTASPFCTLWALLVNLFVFVNKYLFCIIHYSPFTKKAVNVLVPAFHSHFFFYVLKVILARDIPRSHSHSPPHDLPSSSNYTLTFNTLALKQQAKGRREFTARIHVNP